MLWDTHLHSRFSGDSTADPAQIIKAARKLHLSGICFTDHMDLDYPEGSTLFHLDTDAYMNTLPALAADCKDLSVCVGIELGLQPQLADVHRQLLSAYPFDFVIGSSHTVHGRDPYFSAFYEGHPEEESYREYFSSILENLAVYDDFDVYGHIDYVVRYGPNRNRFYTYEKYADLLEEILRTLIDMGKGIELNTGGFRYGLGHPNPTEEILKRYRQLGGEIITIGSDAHAPDQMAYDFAKVPGLLRDAGFRYFTVFQNRTPRFLPLSE